MKLKLTEPSLVKLLKDGGVAVLPTDTIYGLHASVDFPDAIEKIYVLKKRDKKKPFIVLISDVNDLEQFGINLKGETRESLKKYWPGPNSIIFPVSKYEYLHRGGGSLAFRLPDYPELLTLLRETGPMVSTSVNVEGELPAKNVHEAKKVFGDDVNYYFDAGELANPPSNVWRLKDSAFEIVRVA